MEFTDKAKRQARKDQRTKNPPSHQHSTPKGLGDQKNSKRPSIENTPIDLKQKTFDPKQQEKPLIENNPKTCKTPSVESPHPSLFLLLWTEHYCNWQST